MIFSNNKDKKKLENKLKWDKKIKFYKQQIDFHFKFFSILNIWLALIYFLYKMSIDWNFSNDSFLFYVVKSLLLTVFILTVYIWYKVYKNNKIIENTILWIKSK